MACASTVAVVVPSPAMSEVLEATSRTICAPMFSRPSCNSISFATATPSLVMVGDPNLFSITTLRPLGPSVTLTASANMLTPRRIACRDCSPCTICFAMIGISYRNMSLAAGMPATFRENQVAVSRYELSPGAYSFFLDRTGHYTQNIFLFHNQEVFAVNLDFGAGVLGKQNAITLS